MTRYSRQREEWHTLLDELTVAYAGEGATIELVDQEDKDGDGYEAEHMPLAYIEYDEHVDRAAVAVGGRDGRYPVVLRHEIEHPSEILTDSQWPVLPLTVEIVASDGSRTLVDIFSQAAERMTSSGGDESGAVPGSG